MAFRYSIDPEAGLALVEKSGEVTAEQIVESTRVLHRDPAWNMGMDVIWDCTRLSSLVVGPGDVPTVVAAYSEDLCGRDLLVIRREIDYPIAQLAAYLCRREGKESEVFTSMDDALAALGLCAFPEALHVWREQRGAA